MCEPDFFQRVRKLLFNRDTVFFFSPAPALIASGVF